MVAETKENPPNCASQKAKAKSPKSRLVARIARLVRQGRVGLRRLAVRQPEGSAEVRPAPAAKPKRLPRVLTADQFRAFYKAVDPPRTCNMP